MWMVSPGVVWHSGPATSTFHFRKLSLPQWILSDPSKDNLSGRTKRPRTSLFRQEVVCYFNGPLSRAAHFLPGSAAFSLTPSRKCLCFCWLEYLSIACNLGILTAMGMNQSNSLMLALRVWDAIWRRSRVQGWDCVLPSMSDLSGFLWTRFIPTLYCYLLF